MAHFHLSSTQRKSNLWLGGLTTIGLLILTGVFNAAASDADTAAMLLLGVLAVTLGVLVRSSAKRGWLYANQEQSSPMAFSWTGARRLGVAWRSIGILIAGRWLITLFGYLAWGDISLFFLMVLAFAIVIGSAIVAGLFFGWKEASKQFNTKTVVTSTLGGDPSP